MDDFVGGPFLVSSRLPLGIMVCGSLVWFGWELKPIIDSKSNAIVIVLLLCDLLG